MALAPEDFASQAIAAGLGAGGLGPSPDDTPSSGSPSRLLNQAPPDDGSLGADFGDTFSSIYDNGRPPSMPDWARWMPWDVADATKNQEAADEWGQQANKALSDVWGRFALQQGQQALAKAISDAQQAQDQAGSMPDLGAGGGAGLRVEPVGSSSEANPSGDVLASSPPAGQPPTTPGNGPTAVTSENFGQHLLDTLRQAIGQTPGQAPTPGAPAKEPSALDVIQNAAARAGAPVAPDITGQQSAQDYAGKLAASSQNENILTPMGVFNPNLVPKDIFGNPSSSALGEGASEAATAGMFGQDTTQLAKSAGAPGEGEAANLARGASGANGQTPLDHLAQALPQPAEAAATGAEQAAAGAAEAAKASPLSAETLAKAPPDLAPHIETAAAQLGMDDGTVSRALDVMGDPSQASRIIRTKNPARDLTPVQQTARQLYTRTQKVAVAAASTNDSVPIDEAVTKAAQVANPDPSLEQALQQSLEQAGVGAEATPPEPQGTPAGESASSPTQLAVPSTGANGAAQALNPARRQQAIDALMKTKQFSTPEAAATLVDRMGPDAILGTAETPAASASQAPSAATAGASTPVTSLRPSGSEHVPVWASLEGQTAGGVIDRTPLWLADKANTATSDALVRDAARKMVTPEDVSAYAQQGLVRRAGNQTRGLAQGESLAQQRAANMARLRQGAEEIAAKEGTGTPPPPIEPPAGPPSLPSGRAPGNPPPGRGLPGLTPGMVQPALQLGSFGAGAAYGWNEDTSDDLTHHIANALLRGFEASTATHVLLGGAPSGIPGRFVDTFIGNLISPKTAGLKFSHDLVQTLIGGPAINLIKGAVEAAGQRNASALVQAARESAAMYSALVGTGAAYRDGLREAADILAGRAPMSHFSGSLTGMDAVRAAEDDLRQAQALLFGKGRDAAVNQATQALSRAQTAVKMGQQSMGQAIGSSLAQPGVLAKESGGRAIGAVTAFFQRVLYAQEMAAETLRSHAIDSLMGEGSAPGYWTPEAMSGRAMKQVNDRLMIGQATGGFGNATLNLLRQVQKTPLFGGRLMTPFAHIPSVYLDRTISGIPLIGLANMVGATDPQEVLARQILGGLATYGLWQLFGDRIQGGGPPDPTLNKSLRDNNGFLPYSVTDPQSGMQVEIRHLPAEVKAPLLLLGALNDVSRYGADPAKIAEYAKQADYALGLTDALPNLVSWMEGGMSPSQAASQVSSVAPWYARQGYQAGRPSAVDTKGTALLPANADLAEKLKAGAVTGLQEAGVPSVGQPSPKLDAAGKPVPNDVQGAGAFASPFKYQQFHSNAVSDAFNKVGVNIPAPPTSLSIGGRDVPLSGAQQQQFAKVRGDYLNQHLRANMTADRAKTLLDNARTAAENDFRRSNQDAVKAAPKSSDKEKQGQSQKAGAFQAATGGTAAAKPSAPSVVPSAASATPSRGSSAWDAVLGGTAPQSPATSSRPAAPASNTRSAAWSAALGG